MRQLFDILLLIAMLGIIIYVIRLANRSAGAGTGSGISVPDVEIGSEVSGNR